MKQSFSINISTSILDDLKSRIAATRWPDEIDNEKWERGTSEKICCKYPRSSN